MAERWYFVYVLTNSSRRPLYVGVTNSLLRRLGEHVFFPAENAYTRQFKLNRLVYFERYRDVRAAIAREKQLQNWSRAKKAALIESVNSKWEDLGAEWKARVTGPAVLRSGVPVATPQLRLRSAAEQDTEVSRRREQLQERMRELHKIRKRRVPPLGPEGPRSA